MTEQEEHFVHFVSCITWLNNTWRLLNTIQSQPSNPLVGPAFRFAIIEYCTPYNQSHGANKKFKLDNSLIPINFIPLHERIINSRNKIHAHHDLTVMEAKLHVHEYSGQRYTLIAQNFITGVEELPNLKEVIEMVEGTLDNMYAHEKLLKAALQP
ncbi:MAG: hypothetical protein ACRD5H_11795 [Nitrososphaerales archaeon]